MKKIKNVLCSFALFAMTSQLGFATQIKQEEKQNESSCKLHKPKNSFFVRGEFLYWKLLNGGSSISCSDKNPIGIMGENLGVTGERIRVNPGFDLGARFTLGYQTECNLKTIGRWTYYHNTQATNFAIQGTEYKKLYLPLESQNQYPVAKNLASNWKFKSNSFDLDFGYSYLFQNILTVNPYVGAKAAFVRRNLSVSYTDVLYNDGAQIEKFIDYYNSERIDGYGMRLGFASKFMCYKDLYLFTNFSTSLLWAQNKQHFFSSTDEEVSGDTVQKTNVRDNYRGAVPVLEMLLGIMWKTNFNILYDTYSLGIYACWEQQIWLNLSRINYFNDVRSYGLMSTDVENLGLAGLSAGVSFAF